MAYMDAPAVDEMLWSTKENTPVYREPRSTSERVLSNYKSDQSLHPFRAGDQIGTLIEDVPISGPEGERYFKVRVWEWKRKNVSIWTGNLGGKEDYQDFFEAYVRVDQEPSFWIRASRKDSYQQAVEKDVTDSDVSGYISGLRGVPQPIEIRRDAQGVVQLTFANGYKVSFEALKKLSQDAIRTLTTEDKNKAVMSTNLVAQKTTGADAGTRVLTDNIIWIGLGSIMLFGVLVFVMMRRRSD